MKGPTDGIDKRTGKITGPLQPQYNPAPFSSPETLQRVKEQAEKRTSHPGMEENSTTTASELGSKM